MLTGILAIVAIILFLVAAALACMVDNARRSNDELSGAIQDANAEAAAWKESSEKNAKEVRRWLSKAEELETRNANLDKVIASKNLEIENWKEAHDEDSEVATILREKVKTLADELSVERARVGRIVAIGLGKAA